MYGLKKSKTNAFTLLYESLLDVFNPFGVSSRPPLSLPKVKTPAEVNAEAWQMVGDSMRRAMGIYETTYLPQKKETKE